MPLGMLLDCIRERGKAAAKTREELGPSTQHPKTELWKSKEAFAEADKKCAAAEKILGEKKGKLDEARSVPAEAGAGSPVGPGGAGERPEAKQEARASLADQAAYLAKLRADIQGLADEEATPEELAPLKDEATRINERIAQLTKRVEDTQKVLQGATAVLQAADARRQAAAASSAGAETEYKAAQTDANAAADERRRCASVRDRLDGVEQWIDAVSEYHFRNAGSATCFIFMLIGIPLGISRAPRLIHCGPRHLVLRRPLHPLSADDGRRHTGGRRLPRSLDRAVDGQTPRSAASDSGCLSGGSNGERAPRLPLLIIYHQDTKAPRTDSETTWNLAVLGALVSWWFKMRLRRDDDNAPGAAGHRQGGDLDDRRLGGPKNLGRLFLQGLHARSSCRNPLKQFLEERLVDASFDLGVQRDDRKRRFGRRGEHFFRAGVQVLRPSVSNSSRQGCVVGSCSVVER